MPEMAPQPMLQLSEIAKLEEHRQAVAVAELSREAFWLAGGSVCFSGVGSWTNQAQGLGHNGPVSSDDVDRLVDFYVARGVEPRVEVTSFADASLLRGLERYGFTVLEFENVWGCHLQNDFQPTTLLQHELPPDMNVVRVNPADKLMVQQFAEITASGFAPEASAVVIDDLKRTAAHPRTISLLAILGDESVAAAGMEIADEIACLFGATVLPAYRRRGVQSGLIVERLKRAAAAGCELAVIHSNPGVATERTAQRMGFFLAYSKVILRMQRQGLAASP